MYLPKLWTNIADRLEADPTLIGYLPTGARIMNDVNYDDADLPLVSYNVVSDTANDAFRLRSREVSFDIHVYVERFAKNRPTVSGQDSGFDVASNILTRILGDWPAQSYGTAPTFGLDRWTPALTDSGWVSTIVEHKASREDHSREVLHWVLEFRAIISQAAV